MTGSIADPAQKVDAVEFEREVADAAADIMARQSAVKNDADALAVAKKIGEADLQAQAEMRQEVVGVAGGLATLAIGGVVNPATGIAAAIQIATLAIGAGTVVDNRRKDKVIKEQKNGTG